MEEGGAGPAPPGRTLRGRTTRGPAAPRLLHPFPASVVGPGGGRRGGAGRGVVGWAGVGRGGAAWSGELRAASFARSAKVGLSPGSWKLEEQSSVPEECSSHRMCVSYMKGNRSRISWGPGKTTSGDLRALWSEPGGSLELQLCQ
ncbi:uncharacterized protein LOC121113175 [Gallus gallus]|uniref:uncharacterized protein LOC121113175 n=1 Tax=Gallus gallus TaxID=9031 RepID=UPI001EFFF89F|nr:uncharacterized protein LOC121113175 [Gallus gallus]